MPKNIILCSDGTGNSGIKGRGTNVFKLFEAVDLNEHRINPALDAQLAFYDDGVGTKGNTLLKIMGGAAGYGLKRNVKDLYRDLARVYDPGDRIYLFGFSRGAFTARTLAGLIGVCGIVDGGSCPTNHALRSAVEAAYVAYRTRYSSALTTAVRRVIGRRPSQEAIEEFQRNYKVHRDVPIEFIGVWDTVDAVGMPFALASFVNRFLYQFKFPTQTLGKGVRHACHALAIDDARVAFEPVVWTGPDERIEQVWFAGVHSNVGGGYPKQGMSLVALDWMLSHAERYGLRLNPLDREIFNGHASVDDLLYDSRSGLGVFYRWAPRDIRKYCNRSGIAPRIHLTVAERIANGTDDYAPGNIPPNVTVATTFVNPDDPTAKLKEQVLGRRAETVERLLQRALGGRYLLDNVRMQVAIGDASYWFFAIAWAMLVIGGLRFLAAEIGWSNREFASGGAAILVSVACFLLARALGALADHAMSETFSEFWLQHQKDLRIGIRTAHEHARESSARVDLAGLRARLSQLGSRPH
jgi:uncharacterized protein (DUF2235 family)